MTQNLLQALGGLGLFLLGMVVMTDGLKGLAGNLLRDLLMRFTHSPLSGVVTGTVSTAILQSSSATTLATVGFVGAGLLTFPHALGIIFGANIGTTVTGWLVALLGFKLQLGTVVLPLILFGVLLRLFGNGRLNSTGMALAGFGLIFVGISTLQQGMAGFQGVVTWESFPDDSWSGRLQLVAIGIGITLVTQSSSAGVAAAMTALYTDTINFPQAAAMVIGMDVGTTVKAVLASLGGSVETRRTGYSHVLYNLFTATGALLLLTPYVWLWGQMAPNALASHAEIALVAFHTVFNIVGVSVILPFTGSFSRMLQRLVPESDSPLSNRLDKQLLKDPVVALSAASASLRDVTALLMGQARQLMDVSSADNKILEEIAGAITANRIYLDKIHISSANSIESAKLVNAIHALDHLSRLLERCSEDSDRAETIRTTPGLSELGAESAKQIDQLIADMQAGEWERVLEVSRALATGLQQKAEELRQEILVDVASGEIDVQLGTRRLEGIRWLRRVNYHVWRIALHLSQVEQPQPETELDQIEEPV